MSITKLTPLYEVGLNDLSNSNLINGNNIKIKNGINRMKVSHLAFCRPSSLVAAIISSSNFDDNSPTSLNVWRIVFNNSRSQVNDNNENEDEEEINPLLNSYLSAEEAIGKNVDEVWQPVFAIDITSYLSSKENNGPQALSNNTSSLSRLQQLKQRQLMMARNKMLMKKNQSEVTDNNSNTEIKADTKTKIKTNIQSLSWRSDGSAIHLVLSSGDIFAFDVENGQLTSNINIIEPLKSSSDSKKDLKKSLSDISWKYIDIDKLLDATNTNGNDLLSSGFDILKNNSNEFKDDTNKSSRLDDTTNFWLPFTLENNTDTQTNTDFLEKGSYSLSNVFNLLEQPKLSSVNSSQEQGNMNNNLNNNSTIEYSKTDIVSNDDKSTLLTLNDDGNLYIRLGSHHVVGYINIKESFDSDITNFKISSINTTLLPTTSASLNIATTNLINKSQEELNNVHDRGVTLLGSYLSVNDENNESDSYILFNRFNLFDTRAVWLHKVHKHFNLLRSNASKFNDIAEELHNAIQMFNEEKQKQLELFSTRIESNKQEDESDPFATDNPEKNELNNQSDNDLFYFGFIQMLMTFDSSPNFTAYISQDLSKNQHLRNWTKTFNNCFRCISELMICNLPMILEHTSLLLEEITGYARWDEINNVGFLSSNNCEITINLLNDTFKKAQKLFIEVRNLRSKFESFVYWLEKVLDAVEYGDDNPADDADQTHVLVNHEPIIEFLNLVIKNNFFDQFTDSKLSSNIDIINEDDPFDRSNFKTLNLFECISLLISSFSQSLKKKTWIKYIDEASIKDFELPPLLLKEKDYIRKIDTVSNILVPLRLKSDAKITTSSIIWGDDTNVAKYIWEEHSMNKSLTLSVSAHVIDLQNVLLVQTFIKQRKGEIDESDYRIRSINISNLSHIILKEFKNKNKNYKILDLKCIGTKSDKEILENNQNYRNSLICAVLIHESKVENYLAIVNLNLDYLKDIDNSKLTSLICNSSSIDSSKKNIVDVLFVKKVGFLLSGSDLNDIPYPSRIDILDSYEKKEKQNNKTKIKIQSVNESLINDKYITLLSNDYKFAQEWKFQFK